MYDMGRAGMRKGVSQSGRQPCRKYSLCMLSEVSIVGPVVLWNPGCCSFASTHIDLLLMLFMEDAMHS